jgi:hypothetical protein
MCVWLMMSPFRQLSRGVGRPQLSLLMTRRAGPASSDATAT